MRRVLVMTNAGEAYAGYRANDISDGWVTLESVSRLSAEKPGATASELLDGTLRIECAPCPDISFPAPAIGAMVNIRHDRWLPSALFGREPWGGY